MKLLEHHSTIVPRGLFKGDAQLNPYYAEMDSRGNFSQSGFIESANIGSYTPETIQSPEQDIPTGIIRGWSPIFVKTTVK